LLANIIIKWSYRLASLFKANPAKKNWCFEYKNKIEKKERVVHLAAGRRTVHVWECNYNCFLKCFLLKKVYQYVFLFLKNYFWDQHIKIIWKHQKHINSKQKKKFNSFENVFWTYCQILLDGQKSNKYFC
jgi:hypothetical protein